MTLTGDFVSGQPTTFRQLRRLVQDLGIQEGVLGAGDLQTTQRAASANMSVDVAIGFGHVVIDTGTAMGIGHVRNDATANVTITAAHATLPRIDQIIVRVNDTSIPTGSGNVPTLEVLTGTATTGATTTNRLGATALPNDCMRLADVLVGAAAGSIVNTAIRDRRPWARGAYVRIPRTAGSYTTTSSTVALVDGTNLQPRIECSGVPLRVTMHVDWQANVSLKQMQLDLFLDGATTGLVSGDLAAGTSNSQPREVVWEIIPAGGSHLIGPAYASVDNTTTVALLANTASPLIFSIEEIVRQQTANNAVTSG